MKKILALTLCLLMVLALLPAVSSAETLTGEFTWWTFFDQAPFIKEQFEKANPGIKINLEVFGGDEYQTKLLNTLTAGEGVPDMFDLEEGYVYKFLDSPLVQNLDEMGLSDIGKDYYPWAIDFGRDSTGALKGICDNVSPVAFWYNRSAMKQWLGTDDDAEISEKLSSWDKILEAALDIKTRSEGKVWLWPNLSEMVKVEGYSLVPFVRDGAFSIDQGWMDLLATMRKFNDAGAVSNLGSWSGEWATAWNEGSLLIRVMPSWDFFTDWDKNTGNVGVAKPFKTSYEGGTYRAVYANSEKKDLIAQFLKFITTVEYQTANLDTNNQMPANKLVLAAKGENYSNEKFGGQNILKTYDSICTAIADIRPDKYTRDLQNLFGKHVENGLKEGKTDDEIISAFKAEVKDKYPELQGL